jgi:hypothetical protein
MANAKFIKNKKGQKVSVVLDIKEYEKLMEDLEELDAIRAYDAAKASGETPIPYEQVLRDIPQLRK